MKRLLLCVMCCIGLAAYAVDYCATGSWGYAGTGVTGGGNTTPTLVSSYSELNTALGGSKAKSNKVVIITQDITFTSQFTIQDATNITLMALPGVKLSSNQQDATNSGILYIKRSSNIILRNLTFVGPGAYDVDGNDNLCFDKVTDAWVDHCDFQDACDGNFDIKSESDNITVSWCRFRYLKAPRARECDLNNSDCKKLTDDHRFSNLVGSSSSDKPADGTYNITYGYCWWDEGCRERMTRCRNASLHFLNCYWNSSVANYYIGPENADCYVEGCTFEGSPAKSKIFYENYGGTNGVKFINCSASQGVPSNVTNRSVLTPSYSYTALSAAEAKAMVTNSSCGAGATLTVTTEAAVSSSCAGSGEEEKPGEDEQTTELTPLTADTWWNFSDDDFKDLGAMTTNMIVRNLLIVANSSNVVTVEGNSKTIDGISFTSRLKLGGTGAADYRNLQFKVTGPCTITAYLISSSSKEDRTLNIASGTFANVVGTMEAPKDAPVKQSFNYTGGANTLYLYSPSGGINFYGIRVSYPGSATGAVDVERDNVPCTKVLRDGQLYLIYNGTVYDVRGQRR